MALLQVWQTLKEAISAHTALSPATLFAVLALLLAIYYVLIAGLFGSPRVHCSKSDDVPQSSRASSSSSSHQSRYQVFLSFRGEDTRHNFTSHLLESLKGSGINVFFDEEKLEKGEELSPALLNAIEASKISIIILSKDYASSKSCLTELSKIMERKLAHRQIVLPIFYKVNPSDVRHSSGSFEKSFNQHLNKKRPKELVEKWKTAFTQAGDLKGWHIDGGNFDRSETEYIKDIVKVVIEKLSSKATYKSEELVGRDDDMKKILLLIEEEHVRVVGIWGMAGIGKTTLAEAVYNEVSCHSKFDAHHFLQDVRERSLEKYGMQSLQHELLSKLLKGDIHIDTRFIGSTLIQDRLRNVKVFVVFDDVNQLDQLKRLGAEHFGPGSEIIVTSRDRQVLRNIGVDKLHWVRELNEDDSLQLFCKFAFKQYNPNADFRDLAMKFVGYCGGNPLALKVLGAALYQKSMCVWVSALDRLKECSNTDISGVFRISYDGLDPSEKNLFLDIACFVGWKDPFGFRDPVAHFCEGAEFGISNLVDKCLVDDFGTLKMHDLLKEMGWDIVRQESEDLGRRSRLWIVEDVCHVLKNNKGTASIKGISLDMSRIKVALQIRPSIFKKMDKLVYLRFYGRSDGKLLLPNQNLTYLPDALKYFQWDECPLKSLPTNFSPNNLVELRLINSKIEHLWNGDQDIVNLRVMDLSGCKNLCKIPSLSGAKQLEELVCIGCESLVELPCMTHLTSLEELRLRYCPITKFPEIPTDGDLEVLDLARTQIEEVPDFIGSVKKLSRLDMRETKIQSIPSSVGKLDNLKDICLSNCPNLTDLKLNMTPIEEVPSPSSISGLRRLETLNVENCESLKSLLGLPPVTELKAKNCTSLERVSFIDIEFNLLKYDYRFDFGNCTNLSQDAGNNIIAAYPMIISPSNAKIYAKRLGEDELDDRLDGIPDQQWRWSITQVHLICYLPRSDISDKFENQSRNSFINVKLNLGSVTNRRFLCFALCLLLDLEDFPPYSSDLDVYCKYKLKGLHVVKSFRRTFRLHNQHVNGRSGERLFILFGNFMVHRDMQYTRASFAFRVVAVRHPGVQVKVEKCGVHVFYVDAESFAVSHAVSNIEFSSDEEEEDIGFNSDEDVGSDEDMVSALMDRHWFQLQSRY